MSAPPGPLDRVASIKVKLGLLVAVSVLVAAVLGTVAAAGGVAPWLAIPVTVALALGVTQLLAVGMTSPLREMTEAARRMARGDYHVRVQATSRDEIGQLAAAFNQMAADLASVDHERRDLVATVSHELRTPLTGLSVRLENLVDDVEAPEPEVLAELLAQVRGLGALVADLLDLSRSEAGATRLDITEVELSSFLGEVARDLTVHSREVGFDVRVAPADLVVRADPTRLRQLVGNLLDNAARHSPAGSTVVITAAPREGTPGHWTLEVQDLGPGVPPEHRERVFQRFGTLDHAGGGTGLGLAIARTVAELHGGTLRFADPPSKALGARAVLELPVDPRPEPRSGLPRPPSIPPQEAPMPTLTQPPSQPAAQTAPTAVELPTGMDAVFGRFWPEVGVPARRDLLLASAAVGLLAAVVLPFRQAGLGTFLVLAAAGIVVAVASAHRWDRFTVSCGALSALLASTVVLRDAAWIVTLCVLAGAAVMTAGACRGRTVPGFVLGGLAWPLAGLRGLPWLGRSARGLAGRGSGPALARTAVWSLLALGVFGLLFASADALFAHWIDAVLPDWTVDTFVLRAFLAVGVGGVVLAAAYLALNPPVVDATSARERRPVQRRYEWLAPVLLIDAVFVLFLLAQATVVFGGHGYLRRTTGLTYADYVHQGFGQLTVATGLTLLVVWAAARKAPVATAGDRLWLRGALGALCVMTLVVVASALYRMHVYQQAYGFTRLRLLVDVFEAWLGLLVVLVLVAGLRLSGRWLPRVALLTGAAALAGLALANPDAWIARHNIDRYQATGKVDWWYLSSLSADAVPATAVLTAEERACAVGSAYRDDGDWLSWNLGRSRARAQLAEFDEGLLGDNCPADLTP